VPIVRRNPGAVSVALGPDRGGTLALDTDPKLKVPDAVPVKAGETARIGITPLEERPSGKYRTTIRLMDGPTLVGLLSVPLAFESSAITARCIGLPMTAKSQPAVRVSLQNGAEKEQEVTVRFRDIWTSGAMRPAVTEARLKLPALSTASTDFPVTRDRVHLNQNYPVSVDVVSADGFSRTFRDPVHFRAIPRATSPIQVDADLADWNTGALLPLEPNWMWGLRSHTNSGASKNYSLTWKEQNDPEGNFRLYLLWRDDSLYLAATVNNTSRQHPAVDKDLENLWAQDCLYVVMYPSEFVRGEGTATFPHKMHLGLDGRGKPCLQDGDGNVFLDPKEVDCDYAVRETERGYTYEFRMGPKYPGFRGLKVRPGAHLSLSVMAWRNKGDRCYAFFRHFASFEGSIGDMGAFVLVDE
jgi:hypothetical protein